MVVIAWVYLSPTYCLNFDSKSRASRSWASVYVMLMLVEQTGGATADGLGAVAHTKFQNEIVSFMTLNEALTSKS